MTYNRSAGVTYAFMWHTVAEPAGGFGPPPCGAYETPGRLGLASTCRGIRTRNLPLLKRTPLPVGPGKHVPSSDRNGPCLLEGVPELPGRVGRAGIEPASSWSQTRRDASTPPPVVRPLLHPLGLGQRPSGLSRSTVVRSRTRDGGFGSLLPPSGTSAPSAYVNGMPEEIEKGDDRKRDDDVDGPVRHFNPFHVFVCSTSAVSGDFGGFRVISGDFVPT